MKCELIKVCGMRDAENIRMVEQLGVSWMGFIFWPGSKRYVGKRPEYLPSHARRVGVFVDEEIEKLKQTATDFGLDIIQLHGQEPPGYVSQLRHWKTIKAFNISTPADLEATRAYEGLADYFLFDTKGQTVGGNGTKFDWQVLQNYDGPS